jgi:hypothetical protein
LDIGNHFSATLEIEVGRSGESLASRQPLLGPNPVNLMTRFDCRTGTNSQGMKFFLKDDLNPNVVNCKKGWDRLRVICKQPHQHDVVFGLSTLALRGQRLDQAMEENDAKNNENVTSLIGKIGGSSTKAGCSGDQISQAADYYQAGSRASKLVENSLKKFNFKSKTDENRSPQFVSPSRKRLREEDDLDSSKMSSEASTSSSSKVSRNNVAVHDLNIKPAAAVSSAKLKSSKVQKAKNQQRQSAAENKTSAAELPVVIKSKSDFLKFSPAELRKAGILVQNRSYKKVRELPLANGDDIKVKPGEKVTFFKNGQTQICMSYNGKMFVPLVDDEHIRGIFKDYTDEEFSNSDSKAVQKIVMKVKVKEKQSKPNNDDQIIAKTTAADMTVVVQSCPICGKQFNNEAKLISHAANCNGEVENDDKCPICSCIFRPPNVLAKHAQECAESFFDE